MKKHIYILGINMSDHDRSVCLLKDGRIACAIANERLDRRKHSFGLAPPMGVVVYCLRKAKIELDRIDLIVVGKSINSALYRAQQEIPILDQRKIIEIPFPGHHLSHALSAYYCSPFKKSAVLVVDQMGSWIQTFPKIYEKYSVYLFNGTDIKVINKYFGTEDDLSLGLFYDYFTAGFEFVKGGFEFVNELWGQAGKLMGLSSYGKKIDLFPNLIKVNKGNTIILKNDIYRFFKKLGLEIDKNKSQLNACVKAVIFKMFSDTTLGRNLAYKAQAELEKVLLLILDYVYKKTHCDNLCLAGGVALNCIANGKILKQSKFKNIFIQPGGMDDGTSIGLAFYGWHHIYKKHKRFILTTAYLGRTYSTSEVLACLEEAPFNIVKKYFKKYKNVSRLAALHIARGELLGWFQGASEFGPRALGHRSIIADPRNNAFKDILNKKKGRELFRPFAASVLLEECKEYFDLDVPSPFMLVAVKVKENQKSKIPAVVHVDDTIRIQTVTEKDNDIFYNLINEFKKLTGIPLVLNTSFNTKNEPLAENPKDALRFFFKMELDCLIINEYMLERNKIPKDKIREVIKFINSEGKDVGIITDNITRVENIYNYKRDDLKKLIELKLLKAEYYTSTQFYKKAIREYNELIKQNPDIPEIQNGDIFVSLGKIYLSLGQYKKAIREFKKREKISPEDTQIKILLARCYKHIGQIKKCNRMIDAILIKLRENNVAVEPITSLY